VTLAAALDVADVVGPVTAGRLDMLTPVTDTNDCKTKPSLTHSSKTITPFQWFHTSRSRKITTHNCGNTAGTAQMITVPSVMREQWYVKGLLTTGLRVCCIPSVQHRWLFTHESNISGQSIHHSAHSNEWGCKCWKKSQIQPLPLEARGPPPNTSMPEPTPLTSSISSCTWTPT